MSSTLPKSINLTYRIINTRDHDAQEDGTHLQIRIDENVCRFDVTVCDAIQVQHVDSVNELVEDILGVLERHGTIRTKVAL